MADRPEYQNRKRQFARLLTVYGRNPVFEALSTPGTRAFRLHLADSNHPSKQLNEIEKLARNQGAEVLHHSRDALSRISKNKKQDQGVAVDLELEGFALAEDFLKSPPSSFDIIALDRITNPQNLGMIIRSVCASPATALLLPEKGCAKIDSLVIKASAGTVFKAPILKCEDLSETLRRFLSIGTNIYGLDLEGKQTLLEIGDVDKKIFVLGNETEGLSSTIRLCCTHKIMLPMERGVESLNVAVVAGMIAFRQLLN